ncbi:hypothetical protein [Rubellimicrobium roseum]|uniref:VOC family protein n=1 Tax=Rubellimicrobium roseum TaxID=687525 RepID=A0A5C4ND14_9RHOB|nr:hypothetical protein [Rubellimicrobium roseum]TNC69819.1 hypothetical protein FHG71_13450 [Rubellimicrobium roseum]
MTIPRIRIEGLDEARRSYAAIFRPPARSRVLYTAIRTRSGWRRLADPARTEPGHAVALTLSDPGEGRRVFDALAIGGRVETPYQPTVWSPGFGRLIDRWGTRWMVDAMPAPRGGA